ncbi:hypothetical protein RM780_09510 [Streptomyces sp. DSM 44917]|uniref:Extensin n=1 Tax=Streptomyces boetiae TaxID=3075541 RepID=A0ABU2L7B6_9ACTN|nr:hypothetical protein [Streptomyces sp. DSM 44917]MDT0307198.1 hypothetical protein [Streptomyces sp. DSM 44917]
MSAADVARLRRVQRVLTRVLVLVAVVALVFTATSVTLFAIRHGVHPGIAWLLDPMVALALGAVLITDGVLAEYGIRPGGWATCLRWFTGLATWVMNCWDALWPEGTPFGVPRQVDPAGLVLHSIPPVLLIVLAEAITHYRRDILAAVRHIETGTEAPAAGRPVICGRFLPLPAVPAKPRPAAERSRKPARPAAKGRGKSAAPARRSDAELLAEARKVTAEWPVEGLTADALMTALRIGPPRARALRDTLRAERLAEAAPEPVVELERQGVAA